MVGSILEDIVAGIEDIADLGVLLKDNGIVFDLARTKFVDLALESTVVIVTMTMMGTVPVTTAEIALAELATCTVAIDMDCVTNCGAFVRARTPFVPAKETRAPMTSTRAVTRVM